MNILNFSITTVTVLLAAITAYYMHVQTRSQKDQIKAQLILKNRERYDDKLKIPKNHIATESIKQIEETGKITRVSTEEVADFFEDVGMQLKRNFLDVEMIWDTFGRDCIRWWFIYKNHIENERQKDKDSTYFSDFEELTKKMMQISTRINNKTLSEIIPSNKQLETFLEKYLQ